MSDVTLRLGSNCYHGEEHLSYASDSLITFNYFNGSNCSVFQQALRQTRSIVNHPLYHEWRLQVALELQLSIITRCMRSQTRYKYAECGIGEGHTLLLSFHYFNLISEHHAKCFADGTKLLMDTFSGLDRGYVVNKGLDPVLSQPYHGTNLVVFKERISDIPNCTIVPGTIPDSLASVPFEHCSPHFLHIDMNHSTPEVAALDFFAPSMKAGSVILFDDYSFAKNSEQRDGINSWCKSKRFPRPLNLPTGQAFILL